MQNKNLGLYEGHAIKINDGMINLTNMWKACGAEQRNKPVKWLANDDTTKLIEAVREKEFKGQDSDLLQIHKGRYGGTFAHPVIGLAYAKYLSPDFHIWCNERLLESGLIEVGDQGEVLVKLGEDGLSVGFSRSVVAISATTAPTPPP